MIPYIELHRFFLGPIPIQVWGTFVALGILVGGWAAAWMAKRRGLQSSVVWDSLGWIILAAFVSARLFHVVFYEPAFYVAHPSEVFSIWNGGLSVMGGFIGAAIAGICFFRRHHLDVWKYTDAMLFGLPLGLAIGRIGCFLIHDHPGTATSLFLGVRYPDGVVRFDHGLLLSLSNALLFVLFLFLAYRRVREGWYIVVFLLWYGVSRFLLDFFRATSGPIVDERYFHLTPAQYGSLGLFLLGLFLLKRLWKTPVV